ncbi:MAG: adenylate/guanylate cyclase domain-containing protein, partial [Bacteroidales bacterium]|nr:adenylate/guanylate cyclase domain-containing protein [Bacteroidales bacterium]
TAFDKIIQDHHCERIKTIGDSYMAVCGLPDANRHDQYRFPHRNGLRANARDPNKNLYTLTSHIILRMTSTPIWR